MSGQCIALYYKYLKEKYICVVKGDAVCGKISHYTDYFCWTELDKVYKGTQV